MFAGSFRFLNATTTVYESSQSAVQIPVIWENGTTSTARARFQVICGSACSPADFVVKAPQDTDVIKWERPSGSAGVAVKQYISLSILDDGEYEQPETFTIRLLPAEQEESDIADVGTIGSIGEVVVTIAGPNNGRLSRDTAHDALIDATHASRFRGSELWFPAVRGGLLPGLPESEV